MNKAKRNNQKTIRPRRNWARRRRRKQSKHKLNLTDLKSHASKIKWINQRQLIEARSILQNEANFGQKLNAIFEADRDREAVDLIEVLKLEWLQINERQRTAPIKYSYLYDGTTKMRSARKIEVSIPDIANYPYEENFVYKFLYRAPFNKKTIVKTVKSTRKIKRRAPTDKIKNPLTKKWKYQPYFLYRLIRKSKKNGREKILYENRLTTSAELREIKTIKYAKRNYAFNRVIDYEALCYNTRKMSDNWRLQLMDAVYGGFMPKHPKIARIYRKVVLKVKSPIKQTIVNFR